MALEKYPRVARLRPRLWPVSDPRYSRCPLVASRQETIPRPARSGAGRWLAAVMALPVGRGGSARGRSARDPPHGPRDLLHRKITAFALTAPGSRARAPGTAAVQRTAGQLVPTADPGRQSAPHRPQRKPPRRGQGGISHTVPAPGPGLCGSWQWRRGTGSARAGSAPWAAKGGSCAVRQTPRGPRDPPGPRRGGRRVRGPLGRARARASPGAAAGCQRPAGTMGGCPPCPPARGYPLPPVRGRLSAGVCRWDTVTLVSLDGGRSRCPGPGCRARSGQKQ